MSEDSWLIIGVPDWGEREIQLGEVEKYIIKATFDVRSPRERSLHELHVHQVNAGVHKMNRYI